LKVDEEQNPVLIFFWYASKPTHFWRHLLHTPAEPRHRHHSVADGETAGRWWADWPMLLPARCRWPLHPATVNLFIYSTYSTICSCRIWRTTYRDSVSPVYALTSEITYNFSPWEINHNTS
jgi:hypothetical protein